MCQRQMPRKEFNQDGLPMDEKHKQALLDLLLEYVFLDESKLNYEEIEHVYQMSNHELDISKPTVFEEILVYKPSIFRDYERGSFYDLQRDTFSPSIDFRHDKFSTSAQGVLRGLRGDHETHKLVSCLHGSMHFVIVDNRKDSPTYLGWDSILLDDKDRLQVLLPLRVLQMAFM